MAVKKTPAKKQTKQTKDTTTKTIATKTKTTVVAKATSTKTKEAKKTPPKAESPLVKDAKNIEHDAIHEEIIIDNDIIPGDDEEESVFEAKKKEISQTGYNKLLEELRKLEEEMLPNVNARIKEAREFGDLSENAEYQSAINEKQMLEVRIAELKETIDNSVLVDWMKKGNTVQYGSTVVLEIEDWDELVTVTIIGSAEITYETEVQHISFDSPIGLAIEGKKAWDICKARGERGRFDVKIIEVR